MADVMLLPCCWRGVELLEASADFSVLKYPILTDN